MKFITFATLLFISGTTILAAPITGTDKLSGQPQLRDEAYVEASDFIVSHYIN
jgi:hypothetical protein